MVEEVTKAELREFIERHGADAERWVRTRLKNSTGLVGRTFWELALGVVQDARKDPPGFVDDAGLAYDVLVRVYSIYKKRGK